MKYATRGLVQEGRLSPLFSQLYALAATTFMSIHLIRCSWYHNSHLRNLCFFSSFSRTAASTWLYFDTDKMTLLLRGDTQALELPSYSVTFIEYGNLVTILTLGTLMFLSIQYVRSGAKIWGQ